MGNNVEDNTVQYTQTLRFYYLPTTEDRRLTLAYQRLSIIPAELVSKFQHSVRELDLSSNLISDLMPLEGFNSLTTLILDSNSITSTTYFPHLPNLQTVTVNRNNVSNLVLFVDRLVASCPNLRYLSMLNNEACPNLVNPEQYQAYRRARRYVIHRLPHLKFLDSTPVTEEERNFALNFNDAF